MEGVDRVCVTGVRTRSVGSGEESVGLGTGSEDC